ncbi:MAG: hypothetical protein K5785_08770 [Nitrosarchaeum sp.]|nr:hypothetical protein [Nitrosarchaeum sp.]
MKSLSSKEIQKFEGICEKILKNKDVRYICLLNKMGKLVVEKKQKKVNFLIPDKKARDLYIKLKLESSLIKDFDDELGKLEFVVTYRKKMQMMSIPIYGYLVMVSAKKSANSHLIANSILNLFEKNIMIQ